MNASRAQEREPCYNEQTLSRLLPSEVVLLLSDPPLHFIGRTVPLPRPMASRVWGNALEILASGLTISWVTQEWETLRGPGKRGNLCRVTQTSGLLVGDPFSFARTLGFTFWPPQSRQYHFKFMVLWSTESDEESLFFFLNGHLEF